MQGEPRIGRRPERPYVAVPARVACKEWRSVNALFEEVLDWVWQRGIRVAGPPFLRVRAGDAASGALDVEVGLPLAVPVPGDGRVVAGAMPAGAYATLVHAGHPGDLDAAHAMLRDWLADRGLAPSWGRSAWRGGSGAGPYTGAAWEEDGGAATVEVWGGLFETVLSDLADPPPPEAWRTEIACLLEGDDAQHAAAASAAARGARSPAGAPGVDVDLATVRSTDG